MKSIFKLLSAAALLLVTGGLVMQACKKPSEGVEVTVNTDIYTSPMLFHFANAKSSATNQPGNFTVTITGEDAALVITPEGKKNFQAKAGVLTLMLEKAAAPSPENPVKFSIIANITGFAPLVQNVTITSDSLYNAEIHALEYSNAASGTSARTYLSNLTNGVLVNAASVSTTTNTTTTETATISFPAQTKFYGDNGAQITSGNLTANLVYFGVTTEESFNAFPGGFEANNIVGEDGKVISEGARFVTAGFLSVNMTIGSTAVKSFSSPLTVQMEVNAELENPETEAKVKAGDVIPIWSLDEKTGQWKFESNATIVTKNGKLIMEYQMGHLSSWNADWYYYSGSKNACNTSVKINATSPGGSFYGSLYLTTPSGQKLLGGSAYISQSITLNTPKVTLPRRVKAVAYNQFGQKVAESAVFNPCSGNTISITVPANAVPLYATVNLDVKARCRNKNISANVTNSAAVYIWNGASFVYYTSAFLTNGRGGISLENDKRYRIDAYYNGQTYSSEITLNSSNFTFSASGGNATLTGSATYNSDTRTYNAVAEIAINCD